MPIVQVAPGAKVRWLGKTDFLVLTHGKIYTVRSVEKGWYRVVDDSNTIISTRRKCLKL